MGMSCQRNGHWPATNHLLGCGLVQPIKELSYAAERCARRGCALIRQLANGKIANIYFKIIHPNAPLKGGSALITNYSIEMLTSTTS